MGDGAGGFAGPDDGKEVGSLHFLLHHAVGTGYGGGCDEGGGGGAGAAGPRIGAGPNSDPGSGGGSTGKQEEGGAGNGGRTVPIPTVHVAGAVGVPLSAHRPASKLGPPLAGNRFWVLAGEDSEDDSGDGAAGVSVSCKYSNTSRYIHSATHIAVGSNGRSDRKNHRIRRINQQSRKDMDDYVNSLLLKNVDIKGIEGSEKLQLPHFPCVESPSWGKYHDRKMGNA